MRPIERAFVHRHAGRRGGSPVGGMSGHPWRLPRSLTHHGGGAVAYSHLQSNAELIGFGEGWWVLRDDDTGDHSEYVR